MTLLLPFLSLALGRVGGGVRCYGAWLHPSFLTACAVAHVLQVWNEADELDGSVHLAWVGVTGILLPLAGVWLSVIFIFRIMVLVVAAAERVG